MPRQFFTAQDIRDIVREQKSDLLYLGPEDVVTLEAVDLARGMGVRLVRENSQSANLGGLPQKPRPGKPVPLPPLKTAFEAGVITEPFGEGQAAGMNVRLKDVLTSADGSPIAAGYMSLDKGEFPWTLTYDEVDIVLEGELVITRGGVAAHGRRGDIIFIPKGSSITFGTPSSTKFVYVTYPADWNKK